MPVVEGIRSMDGDCIGVGSAITAGRVLEQFTHGGPMPPERVDLEALAPSPAAGFATVPTFAFDEQPHTALAQEMPSRARRQTHGRSDAPPLAACEDRESAVEGKRGDGGIENAGA